MSWAAVAVAGVGAVETGIGAAKASKARKRAAQLNATRPKESISPETKEAVSLQESELSKPTNPYGDQDRDFTNSLDAILKGGGDANSIGQLFSSDQAGRGRQAAMQEQIRLAKVNNLVASLKGEGQERQDVFGFNEWMPWADASQANAAERQSDQAMVYGGINTAVSGMAGYLNNRQTKTPTPKNQEPYSFSTGARNIATMPNSDLPTNINPSAGTWMQPSFTPLNTGNG